MKTEIENLLEIYSNLEYEDGYFYPDADSDGYLTDANGKSLNAIELICEFFDQYEIPENVDEVDPEKINYIPVSGWEYVRHTFEEDYQKAFNYIKPKQQ